MTIREAALADIPALVAIGVKFHAMSPHRGMAEYDTMAVSRVLRFMIESPQSVILTNGSGAIGGTFSPVYFNPAKWQLEENFWYAGRDGMELLTALTEHAMSWGASFVMLSTLENTRSETIDKVLKRKGFVMLERRYMKELA
jgi:hypothetical protein